MKTLSAECRTDMMEFFLITIFRPRTVRLRVCTSMCVKVCVGAYVSNSFVLEATQWILTKRSGEGRSFTCMQNCRQAHFC